MQSLILAYVFLFFVGIELVTADLDDPPSLEKAVKDAYGVFLVTNYWTLFDASREIQQVWQDIFTCYDVNQQLGGKATVISKL